MAVSARLIHYAAEPTISADLSDAAYFYSGNTGFLESPLEILSESPAAGNFLRADSSPLSLLRPSGEQLIYAAKRGETFASVAAKLRVWTKDLEAANPGVRRISAGQEIIIPR